MSKMMRFLPLMLLCVTFTSCHRNSRDVWEDTKTAGRYMRRGFDSFLGRHTDETPFAFDSRRGDMDFVPLMSENNSEIVYSENLPPSRHSPGEPGSAVPGIEGFAAPSGELATLFNNIHFETDNYTVKGKENLETLDAIANYLSRHGNIFVFVEGHADERGAAAYNLSLGSKRSNSVRSLLAERGVDPDRLFTISYGKERPVASGHDESSWSQNRRAQFKIYEK